MVFYSCLPYKKALLYNVVQNSFILGKLCVPICEAEVTSKNNFPMNIGFLKH